MDNFWYPFPASYFKSTYHLKYNQKKLCGWVGSKEKDILDILKSKQNKTKQNP